MRTKNLLTVSLLAACLTTAAVTRADEDEGTHFYVKPGVVIAQGGRDFKDATGLAVAIGSTFSKHHFMEVEAIYFERESDVPRRQLELNYIIGLVSYKYAFRFRHGISVYAGGSVGIAHERTSIPAPLGIHPGAASLEPESDNAFAGGLSGGVSYSLSPRIHFEAGGRFIYMEKTYFTTSGAIPMIHGAVRFQF